MEETENDYNNIFFDRQSPLPEEALFSEFFSFDRKESIEAGVFQEEHHSVLDVKPSGSSDSEGEIRPGPIIGEVASMIENMKQQVKDLKEMNFKQECQLAEYERRLADKMDDFLKIQMERDTLKENLQISEKERSSLQSNIEEKDAQLKQFKNLVQKQIAEEADLQALKKDLANETRKYKRIEKELEKKSVALQRRNVNLRHLKCLNRKLMANLLEFAETLRSKELLLPKQKKSLEQITENLRNKNYELGDINEDDDEEENLGDQFGTAPASNSLPDIKEEDNSDGDTLSSFINNEPYSGGSSDIHSQVNMKPSSILNMHTESEKSLVFNETNHASLSQNDKSLFVPVGSPVTCKVEDTSSNEGLPNDSTTDKSSNVLPDSNYPCYKASKAESTCSGDVEIPNEYCAEIMRKMVLKVEDFDPISPVPSPPRKIKTEDFSQLKNIISSQKPNCIQKILPSESSECKKILSDQISGGFEPLIENTKERNAVHNEAALEINSAPQTLIPPHLHYICSTYSGDNKFKILHQGGSVYDYLVNPESKLSVCMLTVPKNPSLKSNAQSFNSQETGALPNEEERRKSVLSLYYATENRIKLIKNKISSSHSSQGNVSSSVNTNLSHICVVIDGKRELISSSCSFDNDVPPNNSYFATDEELMEVSQKDDSELKTVQQENEDNQSYVSSSCDISPSKKTASFKLPVIVKTTGNYNSNEAKQVHTVAVNKEKIISPNKDLRPRHSSAENPYYLLNDIKAVGTLEITAQSSNNVYGKSHMPVSSELLSTSQKCSTEFRGKTNEAPKSETTSNISIKSLNNNTSVPRFEVPGHENNCMFSKVSSTKPVCKLTFNENKHEAETICPVITSVTSLQKTASSAKQNELTPIKEHEKQVEETLNILTEKSNVNDETDKVCESVTKRAKKAIKRQHNFHLMETSNLTASVEKVEETCIKNDSSIDIHQVVTQNQKFVKTSPIKSQSTKLSDLKVISPNVPVNNPLLNVLDYSDELVLEDSSSKTQLNVSKHSPSKSCLDVSPSEPQLNVPKHSLSTCGLEVSPSKEHLNECSFEKKLHGIDEKQDVLNKFDQENSPQNLKGTTSTSKRKSKKISKFGKNENNSSNGLKNKKKGKKKKNKKCVSKRISKTFKKLNTEASRESLPEKTFSITDEKNFQQNKKNTILQLQNDLSIDRNDHDKTSNIMNCSQAKSTDTSAVETKADIKTLTAIKNVNDCNMTSSESDSIHIESIFHSDPEISTTVEVDIHVNKTEDTSKASHVFSESEKIVSENSSVSSSAQSNNQIKLIDGGSKCYSETEISDANDQQQASHSPKTNFVIKDSVGKNELNFRDEDTLVYSPASDRGSELKTSKCDTIAENSDISTFSNVFEKPSENMPLESDSGIKSDISQVSVKMMLKSVNNIVESKVSVNKRDAMVDSQQQIAKISARRSSCQSSISENESPLVIVEDIEENKFGAETCPENENINLSDAEIQAESSSSEVVNTPEKSNSGKCKRKRAKTPSSNGKKKSCKSIEEINNIHSINGVLEEIKRIKIEDLQTNRSHSKSLVHSLVNVLINPSNAINTSSLLFQVFNYLSVSKLNPLMAFMVHKNASAFSPPSEMCILDALIKVDHKKKNHLEGLIPSAITTLYHLIVEKNNISKYGLSAFCRIFTQLCKYTKNSDQPLMLCSNLIKRKHPFSPFLIASIVGVWHELFSITDDDCQGNQALFLRAISYGVQKKPSTLNSHDWKQCKVLFSEYMIASPITSPSETTEDIIGLLNELVNKTPSPKDYVVTEPLVIFSVQEGANWVRKNILSNYLVHSLLVYAKQENNKRAFCLLSELYVEIGMYLPQESAAGISLQQDSVGTASALYQFFTMNDAFEYVRENAAKLLFKLLLFKQINLPPDLHQWIADNESNLVGTGVELWLKRQLIADSVEFTENDIIA